MAKSKTTKTTPQDALRSPFRDERLTPLQAEIAAAALAQGDRSLHLGYRIAQQTPPPQPRFVSVAPEVLSDLAVQQAQANLESTTPSTPATPSTRPVESGALDANAIRARISEMLNQ